MEKPKVLFFSTGNATRSKMAAAFFARAAGEEVGTASTAVRSGEASSLATEVMKEVGVDLANEAAALVGECLKEHFACVVTLSDDAKERSPIWPFTPNLLHWNLSDPAAAEGSAEGRREEFRRVRDEIRQHVAEFATSVAPELKARAAAVASSSPKETIGRAA